MTNELKKQIQSLSVVHPTYYILMVLEMAEQENYHEIAEELNDAIIYKRKIRCSFDEQYRMFCLDNVQISIDRAKRMINPIN